MRGVAAAEAPTPIERASEHPAALTGPADLPAHPMPERRAPASAPAGDLAGAGPVRGEARTDGARGPGSRPNGTRPDGARHEGGRIQHGRGEGPRDRRPGDGLFPSGQRPGDGLAPAGERPDGAAQPVPEPPRHGAAAGGLSPHGPRAYAALDLGTNNCRLLLAAPTRPGQFRVLDAFSRIVRLGEGLTASGRLGEAAMDRAVEALKVCADKLAQRRVSRARLIATEACRAAANGEEFLERVREQTGLALEIINRETEARLAVSGCGSLVEPWAEGVVLFDIGGGSTEIALIDFANGRSRRLARHIVDWTSLQVGVVSLAERHGGREVTAATFETMVAEVRTMLDGFGGRHALARLAGSDGFHLLGTSGTVTTLAGVHLGLARYDRRRVDGLWLTSEEVDRMMARVTGWSFEERVANPCIGQDRADLVIAGCAILEGIRRTWPAKRLRVADRGLREGILIEMMARDGVWRRGGR